MSPPYYTIIVSGESFRLTRKQLQSEPDNLFEEILEAYQGGDQVEVEEEPLLFKLIQAHLRGYNVLPIANGYIPYMTKDGVLENLLKLAEEYGLDILAGKIKVFQATQVGSQPQVSQVKYVLKKMPQHGNEAWYQYLGKEEYFSMFAGFTARSSDNQSLISSRSGVLTMEGYMVTMSWDDYAYCYALLVLIE